MKQMNNEPVAWGMLDKDGGIYDSISPEEHDREEGDYTIPLYTHPAKTLTDEEIEEFAYAFQLWQLHNPDKALEGIKDFARAILKKASEG
jgi:hypothetical protein